MFLEYAPYIFHRIEIWRIRRKILDFDPGMAMQELLHGVTAMDRQAIPHQNNATLQMAEQITQKEYHFAGTNRPGKSTKIDRMESDTPDDGEILPIERVLQCRCVPTRRPGADVVGP